ncbi:MAG: barstar family protein [Clostridia bacterium]|nr:barstar family protein [Clostridia bacterium]
MKYVFLDGDRIQKPAAMHAAFAEALSLPAYFGKNLDALHDCLTDIPEPVCVIAVNTDLLRAHLGRSANGFWRLMQDLSDARPGFTFLEEPFAGFSDAPSDRDE